MPQWKRVTAFNDEGEVGHFSVRLTREGRVWKQDAKGIHKWGFRIPLRYFDGGIRRRNPDVGWSEECLLPGDPPEVYAWMGSEDVAAFREKLLLHHPDKMTAEEQAELGSLERRLIAGLGSDADIARRADILRALEARAIDIDEW